MRWQQFFQKPCAGHPLATLSQSIACSLSAFELLSTVPCVHGWCRYMVQSLLLTPILRAVLAWHARTSGAESPQNVPESPRCPGPGGLQIAHATGQGGRHGDKREHELSVDGRRDGHQARQTV